MRARRLPAPGDGGQHRRLTAPAAQCASPGPCRRSLRAGRRRHRRDVHRPGDRRREVRKVPRRPPGRRGEGGAGRGVATRLAHGTTVATNAVLQRRPARIALITTWFAGRDRDRTPGAAIAVRPARRPTARARAATPPLRGRRSPRRAGRCPGAVRRRAPRRAARCARPRARRSGGVPPPCRSRRTHEQQVRSAVERDRLVTTGWSYGARTRSRWSSGSTSGP